MREILFRGKTPSGEWVEGDYVTDMFTKTPFINTNRNGYEKVLPETVGQYTGLTDKNGKKIFEGDICSFVDFHSGSDMETYCEGVWEYEDCYFYITNRLSCETTDLICEGKFDGYVIGNIYDNPELLKEGVDNGNV